MAFQDDAFQANAFQMVVAAVRGVVKRIRRKRIPFTDIIELSASLAIPFTEEIDISASLLYEFEETIPITSRIRFPLMETIEVSGVKDFTLLFLALEDDE